MENNNWMSRLTSETAIEDKFLADKKITKDQYNECRRAAIQRQCNITDILKERGYVSENMIQNYYMDILGVHYYPAFTKKQLDEMEYDISFINRFNMKFMEKNAFIPIRYKTEEDEVIKTYKITVVLADPWKINEIEPELSNVLRRVLEDRRDTKFSITSFAEAPEIEIEISLAKKEDIQKVIQEVAGGISEVSVSDSKEDAEAKEQWNEIINEAIKMRASDIHVTPINRINGIKVRYRVDGRLITYKKKMSYSARDYSILLNKMMIQSGMEYTKKEVPQSGAFRQFYKNQSYDIRVEIVPTIFNSAELDGSCIQLRILYKQSAVKLSTCGFYDDHMELLKAMYMQPWGMLLTTGPTGSGKTTTIYSILQEIDTDSRSCYTVEDPVEYTLDGAVQIPVSEAKGRSYQEIVKALMRLDPDILYLGEIRDPVSAEAAVQIANTGHTVYSTLHTNTAYNVPQRLESMGIPSYALGSALSGVIAQRLVRRNCQHCMREYKPDPVVLARLQLPLDGVYWKGSGKTPSGEVCPHCNGEGYKGRIGIYEMLPLFKHPGWEKFIQDPTKLKYEFVSKYHYPDLYTDACRKIKDRLICPDAIDGIVTPNDVMTSSFTH